MTRPRWFLAAAALACHGPDVAAPPAAALAASPAPPGEPTTTDRTPLDDPASGLPPLDPALRCGEPGHDPQDLPAALHTGLVALGGGSLRQGEKVSVGGVQLHYDPDMMVSPASVGVRAPAVDVRIDPAEAAGGPWGAHGEQSPGREGHILVGPYRVDTVASADNQVVTYTVSKRACPDRTVVARPSAPLWMWLSTEAIRSHAFDLSGELLIATIFGTGDAPRVDVTRIGYRHALTPAPGASRTLRVAGHRVTIDQVTPGPHTRFVDGAWVADGDARLHARVRVDPAPAPTFPPAVAASDPCGIASPVRTALPSELDRLSRVAEEVTLVAGERAQLGPYTLAHSQHASGAGRGPGRAPEVFHALAVSRGDEYLQGLSPSEQPQLLRLGADILRIHPPDAGGRVRVNRFVLTCPHEQVLAPPSAPVYLWLSNAGAGAVTLGSVDRPSLQLRVHPDPSAPELGFSSAHASYSQPIRADAVGLALSLDGWLVEVVDVVPGRGITFADHRWQGGRDVQPPLHVQVRVSPE